jgi:hypothetical protein
MVNPLQKITIIYQLNTHKSHTSLATLIDETFISNNNIALIQEPPIRKGNCVGVPYPLTCLSSSDNPRAAIIFNPSLELWQIPHLSDRDCQTAIWYNKKLKPTLVISAYWDITAPAIPLTISKAISEAITKNYQILIGIDANAHHPAWGSPDTNARGTLMEVYLTNANLNILNEGNTPTFRRTNCATHIDITASPPSLTRYVQSWAVLDKDMLSNHACLHTVISNTTKHIKKFLNHKKTDWALFKKALNQYDWTVPQISTGSPLEAAVDTLTNNITEAIEKATPMSYAKGNAKKLK